MFDDRGEKESVKGKRLTRLPRAFVHTAVSGGRTDASSRVAITMTIKTTYDLVSGLYLPEGSHIDGFATGRRWCNEDKQIVRASSFVAGCCEKKGIDSTTRVLSWMMRSAASAVGWEGHRRYSVPHLSHFI